VKKPVRTDFLDYSTLAKREHYCREELRLDRRYAPDLYVDVVAITRRDGRIRIEGDGEPIEYAVRMRRFPADALLSHRVPRGEFSVDGVRQLASLVAEFHLSAARAPRGGTFGQLEAVLGRARDNVRALREANLPEGVTEVSGSVDAVEAWTLRFAECHADLFPRRIENGFIRECHGDLHLSNVIEWNGRLIPFDGIEFNDEFRWIDVLSDTAFLVMDFNYEGHPEMAHAVLSDYLERTGDYGELELMRFYRVYRAMVRSKVSAMRLSQPGLDQKERRQAVASCRDHLELARRTTQPGPPALWVTHGSSGSGKSTGSEEVVRRCGAIRLRSDVERKRLFGFTATHRPTAGETAELYSESATHATYVRLKQLAAGILRAGYSVIVDATFLKTAQRAMFGELAELQGVPFRILDFPCDETTLRDRILRRAADGGDASDADLEVLEGQLRSAEPLSEAERALVRTLSDVRNAP